MKEQKIRRSKQYCYGENQPILDEIFSYAPFVVRLLATGESGNSKYVRAYESVWNTECNNGEGCLVRQ